MVGLRSGSAGDLLDKRVVVDVVTLLGLAHADEALHLGRLEFGVVSGRHQRVEVLSADHALAIRIVALEGSGDFFWGIHLLHLLAHHGDELVEGDGAAAGSVAVFDHLRHLSIGRLHAHLSHNGFQGVFGDLVAAFAAEHLERLFELGDLLLCQEVHLVDLFIRVWRLWLGLWGW